MKKLSYLLSGFVLVALFVASGCGDDDSGTPPADVVGLELAGTWTIDAAQTNQVTFETTEDRTDDYANFTLVLTYTVGQSSGNYTISGGPVGDRPFTATSGTWSFTNDVTDPNASFNITRNDGVVMSVSTLSATDLDFTFTFASGSNSGSRTSAVDGRWSFMMGRN